MAKPSLLARESTTLSLSFLQKGHFIEVHAVADAGRRRSGVVGGGGTHRRARGMERTSGAGLARAPVAVALAAVRGDGGSQARVLVRSVRSGFPTARWSGLPGTHSRLHPRRPERRSLHD